MNPVYLVRDVETMKRITIKDFEHFVDRREFSSTSDPMFGRGLLLLQGITHTFFNQTDMETNIRLQEIHQFDRYHLIDGFLPIYITNLSY